VTTIRPKLGEFITAAGLLAAVLLVWAQLWVVTIADRNARFGLAWVYIAVALTLLALCWATFRPFFTSPSNGSDEGCTSLLALGLFAAALEMAILQVFQSIVTIGLPLFGLPHEPAELCPQQAISVLLCIILMVLTATMAVFGLGKGWRHGIGWGLCAANTAIVYVLYLQVAPIMFAAVMLGAERRLTDASIWLAPLVVIAPLEIALLSRTNWFHKLPLRNQSQ